MQITRHDNRIITTLDASEYTQDALAHYVPHLAEQNDALVGEITHTDEERLEITYTIPDYAQSVHAVVATGTFLEQLELARKFSTLVAWKSRIVNPELNPDNLFLVGGQLKVAHRGLKGYIEPKTCVDDEFLTQYKALVVSMIYPKYSFESLSSGTVKVRNPLCCEILDAETVEAAEAILDAEIQVRRMVDKKTKRPVKKSVFALLCWTSALFAALVLGLGIWIGITLSETVPLQERVIESQAAFMVNNFGEAVSIMQNDNPEALPRSVQYVLATSFVQLENLSLQQRSEVLNHLSPASSENELLYWIRIGRGEFYMALDIALNIGDNQLVLHAYTKLYDMVYADPVMPGAEKQQRLDQYRTRINDLLALFDGDADE